MDQNYKKALSENSKALRKQMTPEERHIWYDFLKKLPVTVHRQKVLYRYIVDFYINEKKLIIEIDGMQHGEEENCKADKERDQFLIEKGFRIVRYTNKQIHQNFKGVCCDILKILEIGEL